MNIKEKFNNLFKYPTTYVFALSGYEVLFYYYNNWINVPDKYNCTAGIEAVFNFFIQCSIFFIFFVASVITYIICETYNYEIKSTLINNIFLKIITCIGLLSALWFITLPLYVILPTLIPNFN